MTNKEPTDEEMVAFADRIYRYLHSGDGDIDLTEYPDESAERCLGAIRAMIQSKRTVTRQWADETFCKFVKEKFFDWADGDLILKLNHNQYYKMLADLGIDVVEGK
ncbi:MAG: hypothetical protein V1897_04500 [Pseudomonadota bacterium]